MGIKWLPLRPKSKVEKPKDDVFTQKQKELDDIYEFQYGKKPPVKKK